MDWTLGEWRQGASNLAVRTGYQGAWAMRSMLSHTPSKRSSYVGFGFGVLTGTTSLRKLTFP